MCVGDNCEGYRRVAKPGDQVAWLGLPRDVLAGQSAVAVRDPYELPLPSQFKYGRQGLQVLDLKPVKALVSSRFGIGRGITFTPTEGALVVIAENGEFVGMRADPFQGLDRAGSPRKTSYRQSRAK